MSRPFSRSLALITAINQTLAAFGTNTLAAHAAVRDLSTRREFQSRGHGRSKRSGINVKALNKMRRHSNGSSYVPYSGAQEKLRRAARFVGDLTAAQVLLRHNGVFNNATGTNTPRRMWHAVDGQGYSYNLMFTTRHAAIAVGHSAFLQ